MTTNGFSPSKRVCLTGLGALLLASQSRSQTQTRISFGVVPYLPVRRLLQLYAPMSGLLEKSLGLPVDIVCGKDYRQHISMLRAGQFDVVADSLFIARMAQKELGCIPLLRTKAGLEPVVVVPQNQSTSDIKQLKGKTICVTDQIAALSILGVRYLRDQGLDMGVSTSLLVSGSHSNSLYLMLQGNAQAAIISRTTLAQIDPSLAKQVRVIATPPPGLAAVVYHVSSKLSKKAESLKLDMQNFVKNTTDGQSFIANLQHEGLVPITADELKRLDAGVVELHRQLSSSS
jgi:phosphonate transport system substrate-binding protein